MAIYSVNVSAIGKGTQKQAGTAGAHVGYITRSTAAVAVLAERMPTARIGSRGGAARKWLDEQEQADRKNGRVVTKVMVALPHELTDEQRADLVRDFCERMTAGRGSWLAAIHRPSGDDVRNHHAHIVLRDKDFETGKVVVGLSNAKSVDLIRTEWERFANAALEAAGEAARIDRRSLADQGEIREPGSHVGPAVTAIERRGEVSVVRVRVVCQKSEKQPKPLLLSDLIFDDDSEQEVQDLDEWLAYQERLEAEAEQQRREAIKFRNTKRREILKEASELAERVKGPVEDMERWNSQRNVWDWEELNLAWVKERRDEFARLKVRADELTPRAPSKWLELLRSVFEILQCLVVRMEKLLPASDENMDDDCAIDNEHKI